MKKLIALLSIVGLSAACMLELPDLPDENTVPPEMEQKATAPKLNFTLSNETAPIVDQEELWMAENYNGKPVLIVFMGSWCPWCKRTMPAVKALNEKYGDQVEIVGAFMDAVPGTVRDVAQEHEFTVKALYNASEMAESMNVNGIPHTILFDKNHRAKKVWEGYSPNMEAEVSVELDKLVN